MICFIFRQLASAMQHHLIDKHFINKCVIHLRLCDSSGYLQQSLSVRHERPNQTLYKLLKCEIVFYFKAWLPDFIINIHVHV